MGSSFQAETNLKLSDKLLPWQGFAYLKVDIQADYKFEQEIPWT